MPVPLIGVSTYLESEVSWGVWQRPAALIPTLYLRLVRRAGGQAVLLPPDVTVPDRADDVDGSAARAVARMDGVIIAGGPDVDPSRYGARRDPRTGPPAPERDAWELALIRAARTARVPLLGVCRGMQLLNVVCGGTLTQHLDGHSGPPGHFASHRVTPVPGTELARLLPAALTVPTYHHQAVDRLGDGLVVSAHADDGTVEAVEAPAADAWTVAVQWHPEAGEDLRVVREFVARATRRAARSPGADVAPRT